MKHFASLIFSCCALTLAGCAGRPQPVAQPDRYCLEESFKKDLQFVTAIKRPISEGLHLTGTIEANPDKVVAFRNLFSGVVSAAHFSLGEKVRKGDLLAEISSTEYGSLNAESESVAAQINVATTKLRSVRAMFQDGIASQRELQEAESELAVLQAEKTRIASTRNLYSANNAKSVFQIKAPATGIVTMKHIVPGMQIRSDNEEPLFTISNLDEVWVMANVFASNLESIQEGMEVEIRIMSYPNEVFTGKISHLSPLLDESARVVKARIVLRNDQLRLKPGMLADITVLKKQTAEAVSIPGSDLIFSDNEHFVVVYKHDCDLEVRKVEILARNHELVFIKEGLAAQEKVVAHNQLLLFNRLHH